jgi:Zn-dependent protease with chaperone function
MPPSPAAASQWKYSLPAENVKIGLSVVTGTAVMVAGLSQVFNPLALGLGLAYAAARTTYAAAGMHIPALTRYIVKKDVEQGRLTPVAEDEPIVRMAGEISDKLGLARPGIYFADEKFVVEAMAPWGLRRLLRHIGIDMKSVLAAIPGANTIVTTDKTLRSLGSGSALEFSVAHEMAHLRQDALSPVPFARVYMQHATRALFWITAASAALGVAGIALPAGALAGGSALAAFAGLAAVRAGAGIINNYGLRIVEQRADRNALYITRDLKGAVGALARGYCEEPLEVAAASEEVVKEMPAWKEAFRTHPSDIRRFAALSAAFRDVSRYPELKSSNDAPRAESGVDSALAA